MSLILITNSINKILIILINKIMKMIYSRLYMSYMCVYTFTF